MKIYNILFLGLILASTGCKKGKVSPEDLSWMQGLLRSVEFQDNEGNTKKMSFSYALVAEDSSKVLSEMETEISLTNTKDHLSFERDSLGVLVKGKRKLTIGDSIALFDREYAYKDGHLNSYVDIIGKVNYGLAYVYPPGSKEFNQILNFIQQPGSSKTQYSVFYQWNNGKLVTAVHPLDKDGHEEIDYQYSDVKNPLWKIYNVYLGISGEDMESLTEYSVGAYQEIFHGTKHKHEFENDSEGRLIKRTTVSKKGDDWLTTGQVIYEYY